MKKIGLVGAGAIGSMIARRLGSDFSGIARLWGIVDIDSDRESFQRRCCKIRRRFDLESLADACDLLIEAAGAHAAGEVARAALSRGKDVLVMSSGGILKDIGRLRRLAISRGGHLYVPSGAIAGLDGLTSAMAGRVSAVTLVTSKSPLSLSGVKGIMPAAIKKPTVVFEGSAAQAVKRFPKNINVSATVSMAGLWSSRTRVKIVAVPGLKENTHELTVRGDFGTLTARSSNFPDPSNPKTSRLAALSAVATLRKIFSPIKVGT
ncbi:MAG: aspartate dehydrogenase [Candidatus Omnitrophica bacterium]|nr:aspartate dehydrogenase [Candidatus Omnitrophota bacterium]